MAETAKKKNPGLWKKIVARIKAGSKGGKPGQWSARKAQLAVAASRSLAGGIAARSLAATASANGRSRSGALSLVRSLRRLERDTSQRKQLKLFLQKNMLLPQEQREKDLRKGSSL